MNQISINDCGTAHEEQLIGIYQDIVRTKEENGEKLTNEEKRNIDSEIAMAYQNIISMSQNIDEVTLALTTLARTISRGSQDLRNISELAKDVVASVVKNDRANEQGNKTAEEQAAQAMSAFQMMEEPKENQIDYDKLRDNLCSADMDSSFDNTMKKAEKGDTDSIVAADLITRSIKYMAGDPKGKGKDVAALILVDKLVSTGDDAAYKTASQLLERFALDSKDVFEVDENGNKTISLEKVRKLRDQETDKIGIRRRDTEFAEGIGHEERKIDECKKRIKDVAGMSHHEVVEYGIKFNKKNHFTKRMQEAFKTKDGKSMEELIAEKKEWVTQFIKDSVARVNENPSSKFANFYMECSQFVANAIKDKTKTETKGVLSVEKISIGKITDAKLVPSGQETVQPDSHDDGPEL